MKKNNDLRLNSRKKPFVRLGIKDGDVKAKIFKNKMSASQNNRWDLARKKKSIWEKYNPNSKLKLNEFGKKNNIVDNNIEIHRMSVQLNYDSSMGGISIESTTFEIITFKGLEVSNSISSNIKSSYGNMIFSNTGDTFNPGFQSAIERNTNIKTDEIRGIEKSDRKITDKEYNNLLNGRYIIRDLNPNLTARKNKNGVRGSKYKVRLDLSNFI